MIAIVVLILMISLASQKYPVNNILNRILTKQARGSCEVGGKGTDSYKKMFSFRHCPKRYDYCKQCVD